MKGRKRLDRFLILRLVIALAGFALLSLSKEVRPEAMARTAPLFLHIVLGVYCLEAVAALALVHAVQRKTLFAAVQIAIDLAMEGIMVANTGGAESLFCPLFFASVFATCTVLDFRGSMITASAATVIMAFASMVAHIGGLGSFHMGDLGSWRVASYLLTYGLALHGVSILNSRLVGVLTEAETLTEEIIENMAEGIIAIDSKGRILALNEGARRLLLLDGRARLYGKNIESVLAAPQHEKVLSKLMTRRAGHAETVLSTGQNQNLPVEIKVSPLADKRGRTRGNIMLIQDLSLRKAVDKAAERIAKLEAFNAMARGIAHEVRNPLASMCGCAQEIAKEPHVSEQTRQLTRILERESQRVEGILEEFLNFTRIQTLKRRNVALAGLLSDVKVLLQNRQAKPWCAIEVADVQPDMTVSGDRELLTQMLLNLGINAQEAMTGGEGRIRISVQPKLSPFFQGKPEREAMEQGIEIQVADTGCGISKKDRLKVFTPFYSTKPRGTGLGLAIVHRVVRIHGGTIDVDGAPGRGSVFRIWLPASTSSGHGKPLNDNSMPAHNPCMQEAQWS